MAALLNLQGYRLTFDDEFNTFRSSPDGSSGTWKTQFYYGGRYNSSNGEQQYYSDSSVGVNPFSVHNGVLDITAAPGFNPAGQPINSGLITTENSFSQHEGYFEIRAQLPSGQGLWPAFWMMSADKTWPPELDVMEFLGGRGPGGDGGDTQYFWHSNANGGDGGWLDTGVSLTAGYHTYGMLWDDYNITVYFDGKEIGQAPTPAVYADKSMYMLANLAAGGRWPGAVDPNALPAHFQIDYIRAYSVDPTAKAVALQPISSPDGANTTPVLAVTNTVGSGSDTLLLRLSEDAYQGHAQFTVSVDGKQVGGTLTANASHAAGQTETVAVRGDWAGGQHTVQVRFLNDLYQGTADTDRNLYLESAIYNGAAVPGTALGNIIPLGQFAVLDTGAAPTAPAPVRTTTVGSGADTLLLRLSEDAFQGHAQFTVKVDGIQVGGTLTAAASHAAGQFETLEVRANWAAGQHAVELRFLNDLWQGTADTDRNLYVESATYNGAAVPGSALGSINPLGQFAILDAGTVPAVPAPVRITTIGSGSDTLLLRLSEDAFQGHAQFTVKVDGVQVGGTLTAAASHAAGQFEALEVHGSWAAGQHAVEVRFLNDLYQGTADTDRNLYLEGATYNGTVVPGTALGNIIPLGQFAVTDMSASTSSEADRFGIAFA
ncbi:carbohydrate-binding domain-containing protein [Roseomonas sp. BN140053]|uniref:carbohydrate-binding domain-containing protein n=1 Tax=Roseomonas sp. BN140053 TaxID=3391898 RepID=UPI0039E8FDBA